VRAASFTERVLAELASETPTLPCCRAALVQGMRLSGQGGELVTTRLVAARAAVAALHASSVPAAVERLATPRRHRYRLIVPEQPGAVTGQAPAPAPSGDLCCARSRLRGLLLAAGTLGRGDGPPLLELRVASQPAASGVIEDLRRLGVPGVAALRRGRPVVQVRSAAGLATLLSSLGAQRGRLEFEAGRVVGEVRSGVSRRLNAETANLHRTVAAAVLQLEAIELLRADRRRWDALPPALREAAVLRRRRPRASLEVLAFAAGCSRPAMAGRLHRLVATAAED